MEADQPFPSESALLKEFRVSRVTVRRALADLESDGLIRRIKGKGAYVEAKAAKTIPKLTGLVEDLMTWRRNARAKVLERVPVKATREVAAKLDLAPDEVVIRIKRVRYVDDAPLAYVIAHFPRRVGLLILDEDLDRAPIVTLLSRKHGIPILEAQQSIEASLADAELAALLDVHVGSPLLQIERVYRTRNGKPVNFARSFYRADRYQFTATMRRGTLGQPWG
jgi:GntR family transcriptional regulator